MIDLTNRTVDEINALIQKYASVLELLKPQHQPYLAVVIDVGVEYVKEKISRLAIRLESLVNCVSQKQIHER